MESDKMWKIYKQLHNKIDVVDKIVNISWNV